MRSYLNSFYAIIFVTGTVLLLASCHKKNDSPEPPPVIIPTTNPIPYSVLVYLITPNDKTFNADYYRAAKACMQNLQTWYKTQLGKTFILNPVVVDTLTALHNTAWFEGNNGDSISGTGTIYSYYNTKFELKQQLGSKFDTTKFVYFAWVVSDFPDETIPRGVAAEGSPNLDGLLSKFPDAWKGADGHALAHAFGLPEPSVVNDQAIMSTGWPKFPNCIFTQDEKDSLSVSPFVQSQ
jgi:hypothetical protein